MRYLIFTNTPAHVHVYKNVVRRLEDRGHDVHILARDYTCTKDLLEYYDLPFEIYGHHDTAAYSNTGMARELATQLLKIPVSAKRFDPDVVVGLGAYTAYAGTLLRAETILLRDSAPGTLLPKLASKFADVVLTPDVYGLDLGPNHYTFPGLKECAYLHPDVFESDPSVREELGVGPDERFVMLRFNSFDAMHDAGKKGFSLEDRRELVEHLSEQATVLVSDEGDDMEFDDLPARPYDIHPGRMHDALAEASLLIADTGTMVTEASLLGTPAIRSSAFVDQEFGEFAELERHGLIDNITEFDAVVERADELLADESVPELWQERRRTFMEERVNLTELIVDVVTDPRSVSHNASLTRYRERQAATQTDATPL
ncbi:DUF354 domain-containing protein [Haloprofundus halobius]|uniref:DUF354 domain-containing protein n=1 Tax=Haloprofundus halobius TaxID=2876194 RepID=UPI001CCFDA3E|nr:DUF354 domain-containing protein [Haloprofundus halobius]